MNLKTAYADEVQAWRDGDKVCIAVYSALRDGSHAELDLNDLDALIAGLQELRSKEARHD